MRIARSDNKLTVEVKGGTYNGRKPACSMKITRLTGEMINNREAEGTGQRHSLYNWTTRSVSGRGQTLSCMNWRVSKARRITLCSLNQNPRS